MAPSEPEWKTRKRRIDPRLDARGWTRPKAYTTPIARTYRSEEEETANGPADYALWLLLWPALGLGLPFWLFQALTASNLASANDDHSTGVKRWYLGATVLL
ncbi:MAG TPA: hypothetical protein PKU97_25430, partial [Kofleriaceae bacterium]|nr:hypothetical protein [Kofleriaceae bacterium]